MNLGKPSRHCFFSYDSALCFQKHSFLPRYWKHVILSSVTLKLVVFTILSILPRAQNDPPPNQLPHCFLLLFCFNESSGSFQQIAVHTCVHNNFILSEICLGFFCFLFCFQKTLLHVQHDFSISLHLKPFKNQGFTFSFGSPCYHLSFLRGTHPHFAEAVASESLQNISLWGLAKLQEVLSTRREGQASQRACLILSLETAQPQESVEQQWISPGAGSARMPA